MIYKYLFLALPLFFSIPGSGQNINAALESISECYRTEDLQCHDKLRALQQKVRSEKTPEGYLKWLRESRKKLADQGHLSAGKMLARSGIQEAEQIEDSLSLAKAWLDLSAIHMYEGAMDSAMLSNGQHAKIVEAMKDSSKIALGLANRGQINKELGHYPEAFSNYAEAIAIYRSTGQDKSVARVHIELAALSAMTGETKKAIEYNQMAAHFYRHDQDQRTYGYLLTNMANDLIYLGRYDTARQVLDQAIPILKETSATYLLMNAEAQYGRLYFELGDYEAALRYFVRSNERFKSGNYPAQQAYNEGFLSKIYRVQGQPEVALHHARNALRLNQQMGYNEEYAHALLELYEAFLSAGQSDSALEYFTRYYQVRDSLFGIEKEKQLNALKLEYETSLKEERLNLQEAEIELLGARASRERLKAIALGSGLILVLLLGSLAVYNQRRLMTSQRAIARQKAQLQQSEIERNEALNLKLQAELDQRKRELTSQALLMAEKNELMLQLRNQIDNLTPTPENRNQINGLQKQLDRAVNSREDWQKFMRAFGQVHPGFMEHLQSRHTDINTNELRLAALHRLNFTSKEIATLLHITPEGLKKARYRMRKKLGLAPKNRLSDYLLEL